MIEKHHVLTSEYAPDDTAFSNAFVLLKTREQTSPQPLSGVLAVVGFRVVGFRVVGFRVVGFRVVGFRVVGFRVVGFRVVGFRVVGLRVVGIGVPTATPKRILIAVRMRKGIRNGFDTIVFQQLLF